MAKMNAFSLLSLLLVALSYSLVHAASCAKTVAWTIPPSMTVVRIKKGQCVKFTKASSAVHDLKKFTNANRSTNCNFSGSTTVGSGTSWTSQTVTFPNAGTFFYGCSITDHCEEGQKTKIIVSASRRERNLRRRWDMISSKKSAEVVAE